MVKAWGFKVDLDACLCLYCVLATLMLHIILTAWSCLLHLRSAVQADLGLRSLGSALFFFVPAGNFKLHADS